MKSHYSIVVVGAGPTGLTLANLLGAEGSDVLLIDRKTEPLDEPRAVSIDDESLRTMQALGLAEEVLGSIVPGYGSYYYSAAGGRCFARVAPTESPYGFPRRNAFRQPVLEAQLQRGLARFGTVTTLFGWHFDSFSQSDERAWLTAIGPDGELHRIECDYLIGCDGAASAVRRGLGISLEGSTFGERWLIVDLENSENLSRHTQVFCDPKRPCITLPGPNNTRRYEFKLLPGERDEDMTDPMMVYRLLRDHGADPLSTIRRKVVYRFHARIAQRWKTDRVFLAGDAAHLTPPFAGQGMNSGIRDAHNLAWKLAAVVRGEIGPGLLESYEVERKHHVGRMIDLALIMGRVMSPSSRLAAWVTQTFYQLLRLCPPMRDYILEMKYKPAARFPSGFLVADGKHGRKALVGRLFPQPMVKTSGGDTVFLDDVIGNRFALLAYTSDPVATFARLKHDIWRDLNPLRVAVLPAGSVLGAMPGISVVSAADGAFRAAFGAYQGCVLLLRPDHYVAACIAVDDPDRDVRSIETLFAATWAENARPPHRHIAA